MSDTITPISDEFRDAQLGDQRLTRRLMQIAESAARMPNASLPVRAGSPAALEAVYRFLENDRVAPEPILDAHVKRTAERAERHEVVYVAHDTTELKFGGASSRDGLGWLNYEGTQGFLSHFSFCLAPDGEPLGTLALHAWRRTGKSKGRRSQSASQHALDRESERWHQSALQVDEVLHGKTEAVHLMDREGDSFDLLALLIEHEQRFVIRVSHNRRLESGRDKCPKLYSAFDSLPIRFERDVRVSARLERNEKKTFAMRGTRTARLQVRASTEEIFIGQSGASHLQSSLTLNFVEVRECEASLRSPSNGDPIIWRLVTTEAIDTDEQVATIVDAYRRRWLIEEFFKALKTGCKYEEHQLESAKTLLVALAFEAAVAWQVLLLRWVAHNDEDTPASAALSARQINVLREAARRHKRKLPTALSAKTALYEIAGLGGHIKNNGAPGWLVLQRGFRRLLSMEEGWMLATEFNTTKDAIND